MKIDLFYIILGASIGFAYIYATAKPPIIVIKYPSIDTIDKTTYVDDNNHCYRYYAKNQ